MSSILDALKKSERQRNLGRDLIFRNVSPDARPRLTGLAYAAAGGLLLLTVVVGVLWFSLREDEKPEIPAPALSAAVVVSEEPGPLTVARESTEPKPVAERELIDLARPAPRASPTAKSAAASITKEANIQEDRALTSDQAPWLSSLPEVFRSSLPPLEVNIHVYSTVESQRILYINNRPVQQGERIQAGVMVEEIVQDGVVLRFRGQRFKLPRPS